MKATENKKYSGRYKTIPKWLAYTFGNDDFKGLSLQAYFYIHVGE
jgi:hypothetical protein